MGIFSNSEFDELSLLVHKATSEFIPAAQEDLALNLEITDIIKSKRVNPKDSLRLLLTRLTHDNPNVQLLTLQLLDKCVKNGGRHFLVEMAGREFVDVAVSMMDENEYGHNCIHIVQEKLIELFQEWALIFQSDPSLSYLYDTYCALKSQKRVIFPIPSKSLDQVDPLSIVSSLAPPEWSDSPTCQRCRDSFTMTNRKHHCRKCGGTFCQLCSSNEMLLLEMGINEPVRVCDSCHKTPVKDEKRRAKVFDPFIPQQSQQKPSPIPNPSTEEDADLKKAIELSLKDQKVSKENSAENPEKKIDDEALKKAIEASLKETGPNHMSKNNENNSKTLEHFNSVELENISMFHQLIGRLIRTRPTLTSEDTSDLKKLALEMRKLQKRPIEDESFRIKLEESLHGYDLLFNIKSNTNTPSPPLSDSKSSNVSKDLNLMKSELIGDNSISTAVTLGTIGTRLGSMSLENINNGGINYAPIPLNPQNIINSPPQPIQFQPHLPNQIPIQHPYTPVNPLNVPLRSISNTPNYHSHNNSGAPIKMCPEMTIHPHPIHPSVSLENPYAIKTEIEGKGDDSLKEKKKKDKKRKKKNKSDEKDKTKKEKEKRKEKKLDSKDYKKSDSKDYKKSDSKDSKKSDSKDPKKSDSKDPKHENKSPSKSDHKRMKKKSKKEILNASETPKQEALINVVESEEPGRKSPINLIDL